MGRVEFDTNDPDLTEKLRSLEHRAKLFGSNVVQVVYPGTKLQVFVGTNHAHQYKADTVKTKEVMQWQEF